MSRTILLLFSLAYTTSGQDPLVDPLDPLGGFFNDQETDGLLGELQFTCYTTSKKICMDFHECQSTGSCGVELPDGSVLVEQCDVPGCQIVDAANPQPQLVGGCRTVDGPDTVNPCQLPFEHAGVKYGVCAPWTWDVANRGRFWCSTDVDVYGVHKKGANSWGYCDCNVSECGCTELSPDDPSVPAEMSNDATHP